MWGLVEGAFFFAGLLAFLCQSVWCKLNNAKLRYVYVPRSLEDGTVLCGEVVV